MLCCRDGRLREGDQILAIDGQPLDTNVSHQQAIAILQQARGVVELVVARPGEVSETHSPSPSALSDTSKTGSDMVVSGVREFSRLHSSLQVHFPLACYNSYSTLLGSLLRIGLR